MSFKAIGAERERSIKAELRLTLEVTEKERTNRGDCKVVVKKEERKSE